MGSVTPYGFNSFNGAPTGEFLGAGNVIDPSSFKVLLRWRANYGIDSLGTKVNSWTDEVRGIKVSQNTPSLMPTFGYDPYIGTNYVNFSSQRLQFKGNIDLLESKKQLTIIMFAGGSIGTAIGGGGLSYQPFNALNRIVYLSAGLGLGVVSGGVNNVTGAATNRNSLASGNWSVKSLVYDGTKASAQRVRLYNNGIHRGNASSAGAITSSGISNCELTFGAFSNAGYTALNGQIADIIFIDGALTDSEVKSVSDFYFYKYFRSKSLVICDGNSLTVGVGASGTNSYPGFLQALLGESAVVVNLGANGQTTPDMSTDAPTQIDNDITKAYWKSVINVAWECTNDSYFGASQATTYNNYVTYCTDRRAAGQKVIAMTYMSRSGGITPVSFNADRAITNSDIRTNYPSFADGLADVALDPFIGYDGAELDGTYFADQTHLNSTGYRIPAALVAAEVRKLMV